MLIPVTENGDLLDFPGGWQKFQWVESEDFFDTLEFVSFFRGRSSAGAQWKSITTERRYPMFPTCLTEVLRSCDILKGKAYGWWTFRKRGQNYSLRLKVA